MDITCYLPDDLGERAKEADLPFSQLLRSAVVHELQRRKALDESREIMAVHELDVENDHAYTARFAGRKMADTKDGAIYLHEDGRVFWHDEKTLRLEEIEDPVDDLRDYLDPEAYVETVTNLGLKPVVNL